MFTFFKSGKKKINTSIGGRTSMKSAKTHSLELLIELVRRIRPSSPNQSGKAENNIRLLIKELSAHPEKLAIIRETVLLKFQSCDVSNALAESGLMNSRAFMQEFWHRVKWKFLPKLHSKDDLLYLIEQLFYKKSDHRWVRTVSQDCWIEFFELLDIKLTIKGRKLQQQLADSLRLLSYRLSAAGLAKEIMEHFQDKSREAAPFIHQNILVNEMVRDFEESDPALTYVWNIEHIDKIIVSLLDCEKQIQHMRQHRNEHGTSVEQTFLLLKMGQHIGRMMLLLDLIRNTDTYKTERFLEYFIGLVRNQNLQNSIREFISRN